MVSSEGVWLVRHPYVTKFGALGIIPNSKAIISDISDDSNQALGIAILGISWGISYILGPAVSGVIADPIGQYNLNISSKLLEV